jgi:dynein heavy chain 2
LYNYVSRGLFPEDKVIFERFFKKQCPKESNSLQVDESGNIREFVKSVYGSNRKVALIMTSPGSDPTTELQQIATEMRINNCTTLSMGADIIGRAEQLIKATDHNIELLCLTNLHLVIGWLPNLTHLLMNNLKMFVVLVTECNDEFPVSLLEMSVKFAYESAPGLQQQLKRLTVDSSVKSTPELRILSYLHAICCERRHFVPQGWTKTYEFGFNDFRSASNVIQTVLKTKERRLRLDFIRGLLGTVIYGGKLDTKVDDKILQALIERWFTSSYDNQNDSNDEISLLGLSANVNQLRQRVVEKRLIKGLHVLEKATNFNEIGKEFERLRLLWRELTPNKLMNEMPEHNTLNSSPLEVYIRGEFNQIEKLIKQIDTDLSGNDSDVYHQLISNEAPDSWLNLWPNGPQSADLFLRCTASMIFEIRKLLNSSLTNFEFNLSHMFHASSFLNALRQQASRELNVSVDQLKLCSAWGRQTLRTSRSMQVTINGIMIEGALFDGRSLQDCQQDSPLQSEMPSLSLYFLSKVNSFKILISKLNENLLLCCTFN